MVMNIALFVVSLIYSFGIEEFVEITLRYFSIDGSAYESEGIALTKGCSLTDRSFKDRFQ